MRASCHGVSPVHFQHSNHPCQTICALTYHPATPPTPLASPPPRHTLPSLSLPDRVFGILREKNPELTGERRRTVLKPPQVCAGGGGGGRKGRRGGGTLHRAAAGCVGWVV
jgi:hypothetical protein